MATSKNVSSAEVGDMSNTVSSWDVENEILDSMDKEEYGYTIENFQKYLGYYKNIPELGSAIDAKAKWTVGKGHTADENTEKQLEKIKGCGKDTFDTIMENCVRMYNITGDSFCEIIRDKANRIVNLKPLNPGKMKIVASKQGVIKRYEQMTGEGEKNIVFSPDDIFHLAWNRLGDEIHGISIIEKLEHIIQKRNEAMDDLQKVFHRYVKPLWVWQLDTDDEEKIKKFKQKADKTVEKSENIYIPKDAAEAEQMSVPQYSTLDPLPWIEKLTDYFYQATNIPDVILGSADNTVEASAKILYLAFQQSIEKNQMFLENQIKSQLNMEVDFEFPASIEADLLKDEQKDGPENIQPNETEAGKGE
ncbi:MAG: phage portal protein [Elusimicrobiota bacterium]